MSDESVMATGAGNQLADLVLEGGGVRGIALAGAVVALGRAGYTFPRVAASSAGAVVGALVAALLHAGEPVERLQEIALGIDFAKFRDPGTFGRFGTAGDVTDFLLHDGLFKGEYVEQWLSGVLGDLGVRTFGDLRLPPDPGGDLPEPHRYRLVVTASDLSRRRLTLFPWDYRTQYGVDPDEQLVARAVRASAAIPFFFRPVRFRPPDGTGEVAFVDGGLLADFPLRIFDRTDGKPPRFPTFGVRLTAATKGQPISHHVGGPLSLALATVETLLNAQDTLGADVECDSVRTIGADASGVSTVDFSLTQADKQRLWAAGDTAARAFLDGWSWSSYLTHCRGGSS